jgi:serine/threonine protein phosphatase PrpC
MTAMVGNDRCAYGALPELAEDWNALTAKQQDAFATLFDGHGIAAASEDYRDGLVGVIDWSRKLMIGEVNVSYFEVSIESFSWLHHTVEFCEQGREWWWSHYSLCQVSFRPQVTPYAEAVQRALRGL